MPFAQSVWLPASLKHDLSETRRYLKAYIAGKPTAFNPYRHKRGSSPIATMARDSARDLRETVLSLAGRIEDIGALPSHCRDVIERLRAQRGAAEASPAGERVGWFDGTTMHYSEAAYRAAVYGADHDRMIAECAALEAEGVDQAA